MKKVSESTHKFLCALPIAGLVLLTLAMAALWAVALAYAIGVYIAWDSAMAFLTLFGLSFIGAGLCLISLRGLGSYLSKVWFDRFPDAPGAALFARVIPSDDDEGAVPAAKFSEGASDDNVPAEEANKQEKKPVSVKTIIKNAKNENGSVIFKPKYLTMQNVAYVLLVLAVVFVIASAALGSLDADKWVDARSDYLLSRGWYAESEPIRPSFHVVEVEAIELDVPDRKIVIRYDASATMVTVSCYDLYPGEYNISRSDTGTDRYIVSITRTPEPAHDADIDKMLDLCFQPNRIEKQVIVTIPEAYRNSVEIITDQRVIYAKD